MHKQMNDIPIDPNSTPTNVKTTPVNIILPQRLPKRDDNVWLTSPVKVVK